MPDHERRWYERQYYLRHGKLPPTGWVPGLDDDAPDDDAPERRPDPHFCDTHAEGRSDWDDRTAR